MGIPCLAETGSSRWSAQKKILPTNGRTLVALLAPAGAHTTKWSPSAQEACPAGHYLYPISSAQFSKYALKSDMNLPASAPSTMR
jgi:hypothetical protein